MKNVFTKIFRFYYEGFLHMPKWGRTLWTIIILKGLLVFVLLRFLFFPNFLNKNFDNDKERGDYVLEQLTKTTDNGDNSEH